MKKRIMKGISVGMVIILSVIAIDLSADAQTTNRSANIKSKGIFNFQNGTAIIDTSDLTYLADEIDTLETVYKSETLQGLNNINTFFKKDGTITHDLSESEISTDMANVLTFKQLNDGISGSQSISGTYVNNKGTANTSDDTKEALIAATSDNLLLGTAAWANGQYLIGSMANNGSVGVNNLSAGSTYSVPAGYTSGGTVTTATLASQTKGTATAANLSAGVTAWVNGVKITGTGADNNTYYTMGTQEARTGFVSDKDLNNQIIELEPGKYNWYYHGYTPYWHSIKLILTLKNGTTTTLVNTELECYDVNDSKRHTNFGGNFIIEEGQTLSAEVIAYCGDRLFVIMPVE